MHVYIYIYLYTYIALPLSQGGATGGAPAQQDRADHVRNGEPERGARVSTKGRGKRAFVP